MCPRIFHIRGIYLIGSYPKSYYEAAIKAGRILVSGKKVGCDYKIKGGDELTHTVHRHEPAVGLAELLVDENNPSADQSMVPPADIVHEDDSLLVLDKPATLPIHPCGGYNFNSLFEILSHWKQDFGRLFTVHRLDRLTPGLVLIAKTSALARSLGKCIMDRDGCEKIYLSRVKGHFPLNLQMSVDVDDRNDKHHGNITTFIQNVNMIQGGKRSTLSSASSTHAFRLANMGKLINLVPKPGVED